MNKYVMRTIDLAASLIRLVRLIGKIVHTADPEIVAVFNYPLYYPQRWNHVYLVSTGLSDSTKFKGNLT